VGFYPDSNEWYEIDENRGWVSDGSADSAKVKNIVAKCITKKIVLEL